MDKQLAKQEDKILFVKIDNDGYSLGAQRNQIKGGQLEEAVALLQQFREGIFTGSDLAHAVAKDEIAKNGDYNLSGERYKKTDISHSIYPIVELGSLTNITTGKLNSNAAIDSGKYPFFTCSKEVFKINDYAFDCEALLLAGNNAAGIFDVKHYSGKFNAYQRTYVITIREEFKEKVLYVYLKHLLERHLNILRLNSLGSSTRYLVLSMITSLEIPLPTISIQEEIVAEVEGYQKIIDGAKAVVENYKPNIDIDPDWEMVELGKIIDELETGVSVNSENKQTTNNQIGVLKTSAVTYGVFKPEEHKTVIASEISRVKCNPKKDSIIISRMNTEALVGASAYIDVDYKNLYLPDRLWQTVITRKDVYVKYVQLIISRTEYRRKISDICGGTSGSMKNISKKDFLELIIPLPPIEVQQQIVSQIEKEQALVNANKQLIAIFEQKIKDRIAKVWGGDKKEGKVYEEDKMVTMAAEEKSL